jgi:hypothetical protein
LLWHPTCRNGFRVYWHAVKQQESEVVHIAREIKDSDTTFISRHATLARIHGVMLDA